MATDEHFIPETATASPSVGSVEMHHPGLDRTVRMSEGQARVMAKSGWLPAGVDRADEPEVDDAPSGDAAPQPDSAA